MTMAAVNNYAHFVSLDIGGTHCRIALVKYVSGRLKIISKTKFDVPRSFEAGMRTITQHIQTISQHTKVTGVGLSLPGLIDERHGIIDLSVNLPEWQQKPIRDSLQTALNMPVGLYNDVVAAAAGEAVYGGGANAESFVFIIWGTGFGGAMVEKLQGKLHITPFEPGHYIADSNGPVHSCGQRGCPEFELAGGDLANRLGRSLSTVADDDPMWNSVIDAAGTTVTNIVMFHPVALLIFGGGLILKRPFLLEKINGVVKDRLRIYTAPKLQLSSLGDDAALYGAVALQHVAVL